LKSHKTKTDRNDGHKEKDMKKDILDNETTQEEPLATEINGEDAENNNADLVEGEIAAIVAQADSAVLEESSGEAVSELPPGVTETPQNEEHMDLSRVDGYRQWVTTYLRVSDDEGELLGDVILEGEIKHLFQSIKDRTFDRFDDPESLLRKIKPMVIDYLQKVNRVESSTSGIITKYRIRLGVIFNFQKKLVKKLGYNWMEWFGQNYGMSHFRTVNDYMRLAKIPNIIRYAALGKERLLEIVRQLGTTESIDPVGDHIEKNGLDFDPDTEVDAAELKAHATIAISHRKLIHEGFSEIPVEKVAALVRSGAEVEDKHIRYLKAIRQANGDVLRHMDSLIATGGKFDPIAAPVRKAEAFRKTIDRFLDQAGDALNDSDIVNRVDLDLCRQLMARIRELEAKLTPAADSSNN
jgi:hypothetical protein